MGLCPTMEPSTPFVQRPQFRLSHQSATGHEKLALRVLRYISTVMDVAVVQGYRDDNPAGETLVAALPKRSAEVEHHPSVPHVQAPAVLVAIRTSDTWMFTRLALVFLILTGARSGEVRGAVWDEINLNERLWIIPEERMKHGEEHRVALSAHAVAVLEIARSLGSRTGLIFPSPKGGMPYTKDLADVLHRLDIAAVPHGFRSTFRTWCGDSGVLWEQAEASISHVVGSKVERAYARGDLLERRRPVMESWAQYLCGDAVPVLSDFPEHPAARRRRMRSCGCAQVSRAVGLAVTMRGVSARLLTTVGPVGLTKIADVQFRPHYLTGAACGSQESQLCGALQR